MNVSFGKYIPVRVSINGQLVRNQKSDEIPKEVQDVTLLLCDCLSKDKKYEEKNGTDLPLPDQMRVYFASKIKDYKIPHESPPNKSEILPSSVKCANIKGTRYLLTGDDIGRYNGYGNQYGRSAAGVVYAAESELAREGKYNDVQIRSAADKMAICARGRLNNARLQQALADLATDRLNDEYLHIYVTSIGQDKKEEAATKEETKTPDIGPKKGKGKKFIDDGCISLDGFTTGSNEKPKARAKKPKKESELPKLEKYRIDCIVFEKEDKDYRQ